MNPRESPRKRDAPDDDGIGNSRREYPHSSGDRNSRTREDDWPRYKDGVQRDADPSGATDQGDKR